MRTLKHLCQHLYNRLFIIRAVWFGRLFGHQYIALQASHCPAHLIGELLAKHGASIGNGIVFKGGMLIDNIDRTSGTRKMFANITIEDNCHIGNHVLFDLPDKITIREESVISYGVKFMTHADCGDRMMSRWYPRRQGEITIGRGSWIGVGAIILHGVTLGECCVVGAGAVVTGSFPKHCVVAGVPARIVKRLAEDAAIGRRDE